MRRFLFPLAALAVAAVLPLVGCGSGNQLTAKVKGTVKHKGSPIKAGGVSYYHESLGVYNSVIDKDGKYEIETLPAGNYNVTVDTNAYDPDRQQATYGATRGAGAGGGDTKRGSGGGGAAGGGDKKNAKAQEKQKEERASTERQGGYGPPPPKTKEELKEMFTKLDDKYTDRNKTPLKATLKNGNNEVNLDAD